jgi:cytidine deaminase
MDKSSQKKMASQPTRKKRGVTGGPSTSQPPLTPPQVRALTEAARAACVHAYAPYSHFKVGAAVVTETGEIFSGANVENASYGLTLCAERNAVFQAVAKGARKIRAVAIYTPTASATPPCGACRQVINEFGPEADIYSTCEGAPVLHHKLTELLPGSFGPANL